MHAVASAPTPTRRLVVVADAISDIDLTAADTLASLHSDLTHQGVELWFAGLKGQVHDRLKTYGTLDQYGSRRVCTHRGQRSQPLPRHACGGLERLGRGLMQTLTTYEAMRQFYANRLQHTLAATGQQATKNGLTEDTLNNLLAEAEEKISKGGFKTEEL
jgi:MFS superfamily sulfate permease-like transporter